MRRLALVHGFTQTAASWRPLVPLLAAAGEVVAVDAPGHGHRAAVHLDLDAGADLLADAVGRAAWCGYSMGGRLCLHVALRHPQLVSRLVLLGATAGIDDPAARTARRAADDALADRIERIGVAAFLDEWLAGPLFAGLGAAAGREERMANTASGLASSLRLAGTGAQAPLWERLDELAMPVLVVAGAQDEKFTAVGRRLVEAIGDNASLALVAGAGHAAHLETPAAFAEVVLDFLRRR